MNRNYSRPQGVSIFDKNEDIYELSNPFPVQVTNLPADYPLPVSQFNDLSKEATLELVRLLLASIDGKDFSTETTLSSLLTSFNAEDFSSEATLSSLLSSFNAEDFSSETTLSALLTAFNNEDFATEATLGSLLLAFNGEDFASETTLGQLYTAFNNEDFASQTTLADLNSKFNTLGQKAMSGSVPVVLAANQSNIGVNLHNESGVAYSETNPLTTSSLSDLVSEKYDSLELTYVASGNGEGEIETVVYKDGGSVVATLTLGYDAQDRLNSIVRS